MTKELDDIDMKLLKILEMNAKARMHNIAKKMGIPTSTVHHRIKRMEREGIIDRWTIKKNYELLGLDVKAYVLVFVNVTFLKQHKKTQKDLAKQIKKLENVEAVDIMAGEADLLVTARCSDLKNLQEVLLERIQLIEGITKTKTMIAMSEQ
jgi:DNA-binding Lrp family transcriptional regulator